MTDSLTIRPVVAEDAAPLRAFFDGVDGADLTFLPVSGPDAVDRAGVDGGTHLVALDAAGGDVAPTVVGFCGIVRGEGWSQHVGRLGVVLDPQVRGVGLGVRLVMATLQQALDTGLEKVFVEVRSDQQPVLSLFTGLGFQPEALLTDQLRDPEGATYDLVVLAHRVDDVRGLLTATGLGAQA